MRDYYDILGVQRGADEAALKSAFRKQAMEHHPDRNGGCEDASSRFKEINEAYSVLSDPQKRAAYDRFGHAGVNGGAGGGGPQGFGDVHDIFNEVFGDAFEKPRSNAKGVLINGEKALLQGGIVGVERTNAEAGADQSARDREVAQFGLRHRSA